MGIRAKTTIVAVAVIGAFSAMTVHGLAQHREGHDRRDPGQHRQPLTTVDKAAFIDAQLAAVHAGLRLTADQEKLWLPFEESFREKATIMIGLWDKNRNVDRPMNPIEGLRRRAEADTARGLADTKLANAAQPLWNTFTELQKHRFERLSHRMLVDNRHDPDRGRGGPRRHDEHE
jgi:hypothetical protein